MNSVAPGFYRHYTGKEYEVLGIGRHSETQEEFVIYRALYVSEFSFGALWVRPVGLFLESVDYQGKKVPRFTRLD